MQTHVANMWTSEAEFNTTHLPFQIKCVKEKKSTQSLWKAPYKRKQSYQHILFDCPVIPKSNWHYLLVNSIIHQTIVKYIVKSFP